MATNDGSTPTDEQSPGKPPVTSGPALPPPHGPLDPRLGERIETLKKAVESILDGTGWPSESKTAASDLLNTIKSSPKIPSNATNDSQDLIEGYIQILADVEAQLKDAATKMGKKRWKIPQKIKSMASNRPNECTLLFRTCQDKLGKLVTPINESLEAQRGNEDAEASGTTFERNTQPTTANAVRAPASPSDAQAAPVDEGMGPTDSTPATSPARNASSAAPGKGDSSGQTRQRALGIFRKVFKAVEIASGSIPVAGDFVAAAAKVGLACVETIEAGRTMDKNDNLAKELESQTDTLSKLLEEITKTPNADEGQQIAERIKDVQRELQSVHEKVQEWGSRDCSDKGFHARNHAEALKGYQGAFQNAMEELQLLVGLDTRNIVTELKSNGDDIRNIVTGLKSSGDDIRNIVTGLKSTEDEKDRRHLLERLGDGKYGAQGNGIQDVTCVPGTRVEILKRIDEWIENPSAHGLWLRGMAGRGKSTIASTVVENWQRRASCAIFHFRRGQNAVNAPFVCALARQLAGSSVPEVRNAVLDSVQEKMDIAVKRLEEQFMTLFVTPLGKLQNKSRPVLIIVDALDECDAPKDALDFIRLIDRHSESFPPTIKFLLTSRPEVEFVQAPELKKWLLEDLDTAHDASSDLERFIQQACHQIRNRNSDVPESWPSSDDVRKLVEMSQGLFQWARTVITYVSVGSPVNRMRLLLERPSMLRGLDELYHEILSKAFGTMTFGAEGEELLHRVLGTLAAAPYPVSLEVIADLYGDNKIFGGADRAGIILFLRSDILASLSSLLFIPKSSTEPMHLMHTSIRDLLVSDRCKQASYYINVIQHHQQLASLCLEIMRRDLKENIYGLRNLSKPVSEVRDIAEQSASKALLYCCRSWSIHLTEGVHWPIQGRNAASVNLADFETFSKKKLMYWLEVMSFAGAIKDAIMMAKRVCEWLGHCPNDSVESNSLATLWNDVQRFIAAFSEPIQFGPLHIYVSALPHCPVETELWKLYRKLAKVQTIKGLAVSSWSSNIWVRSMGGSVNTVAFSPEGNVLASGSSDCTIRLWDAQAGTVIGEPLTGHSALVWSVCFSRNGKVLASGSRDKTIRLWDSQTGAAIGNTLTGHTDEVRSVCFSPDGKVLASGSGDNTIRLWDTETGTLICEPLTGHSEGAWSVCFSPNGRVLASGSGDNTIRLWDSQTGATIGSPLTGHNGEVRSVCFSPDGKVLASGSSDNTIRLWDTRTRTVTSNPLTGHSGAPLSICFSPDGKVLASGSGSGDHTLRLWDTQTGTMIGEPLTGHSSAVFSACFSPDGKVLASGSYDQTIRLWDTTQTGTGIGKPTAGHRSSIYSVCLSPDGKFLASGSDDQTIQFWDTQTGTAIGEPVTGHSSRVTSVCLSPDGNVLASGSADRTIRLWDTQTRTAIGKPLTGHSYSVRSVCFSPDGKVLASGSFDDTIRLWDLQTGMLIGEPLTGHYGSVRSVCFSPDGKVLASGSADQTIRLWDPQTGTAIGEPLTSHKDWVYSVCFSPDGSLLGGRYSDGDCATWDAVTRQRCDTPRSLPLHWNPAFQDHWVVFSSSQFIWLPPQYWESDPYSDIVLLSGSTLIVLRNHSLSLFDVSQALKS